MINTAQVRAAIAAVAHEALETANVYPLPPTGQLQLPAVVVGLPQWEPSSIDLAQAFDKTTFPVAVIVARSGADDAAAVAELESLWPALIDAINTEFTEGDAFDHTAANANITRAYFDPQQIAGQTYPAQIIEIDFYG